MHIEKIYLQENFMPDPVGDPFKRVTFGIGIAINPGENVDHAIEEAEKQIKLYINKNTHYPEHQHLEERYILDAQLPEIQKDTLEEDVLDSWIKDIEKCESKNKLSAWKVISNTYPRVKEAYEKKLQEFLD